MLRGRQAGPSARSASVRSLPMGRDHYGFALAGRTGTLPAGRLPGLPAHAAPARRAAAFDGFQTSPSLRRVAGRALSLRLRSMASRRRHHFAYAHMHRQPRRRHGPLASACKMWECVHKSSSLRFAHPFHLALRRSRRGLRRAGAAPFGAPPLVCAAMPNRALRRSRHGLARP